MWRAVFTVWVCIVGVVNATSVLFTQCGDLDLVWGRAKCVEREFDGITRQGVKMKSCPGNLITKQAISMDLRNNFSYVMEVSFVESDTAGEDMNLTVWSNDGNYTDDVSFRVGMTHIHVMSFASSRIIYNIHADMYKGWNVRGLVLNWGFMCQESSTGYDDMIMKLGNDYESLFKLGVSYYAGSDRVDIFVRQDDRTEYAYGCENIYTGSMYRGTPKNFEHSRMRVGCNFYRSNLFEREFADYTIYHSATFVSDILTVEEFDTL